MTTRLSNPSRVAPRKVKDAFDRSRADDEVAGHLHRRRMSPSLLRFLDVDHFIARYMGRPSDVTVDDVFRRMDSLLAEGAFSVGPGLDFDVDFYRSICFDQTFGDDGAAFRHYLRQGTEFNIPPNAREFFVRCGLADYAPGDPRIPTRASLDALGFPTHWHLIDHAAKGENARLLLDLPPGECDPLLCLSVGRKLAAMGMDGLACELLARCRDEATATPERKQLVADVNLNCLRIDVAAALYGDVLAAGGGNMWTSINLARALAMGELFPPAYDIMLRVRDRFIADQAFCDAFDQICRAHLAAAGASCRARASRGGPGGPGGDAVRDTADLRTACAQVDAALRDFYAHGNVPRPPGGRTVVAILANRDLPQCWFYRVEQKRLYLEGSGRTVLTLDMAEVADVAALRRHLPRLDALIVHRLPYSVELAKVLHEAAALGVALCYDIDDLIFDARHYPGPFEDWDGSIDEETYLDLVQGTALFRSAMGLFRDIVVSTDELRDICRELFPGRRVHVLRNGLDPRFTDFADFAGFADFATGAAERPEAESFTIVYGTGSLAQRPDWLQLGEPALRRVLEAHARARVVFVGPFAPAGLAAAFPGRVVCYGTCRLEEYWAILGRSDATLSILRPMPRNAAKSELKWTEAACFGVPAVVCGGGAILRATRHGRNALQARTVDEVCEALSSLIEDAALRNRLRIQARRDAADGLGTAPQARALAAMLDALPRPRRADPRPVLMVVNVFFWPEMVGGATRIVKQEVDELIDRLSDRYRVVVVCGRGLTGAFEPYVASHAYRGACVHRIHHPLDAEMDWHHANADHGRLFAEILAAERPRLVHFHAVQRLTASVVAAAAEARIPYVVTVHDGWWIADDLFFRDGADIAVPSSPEVASTPEPPRSVLRRATLARLLAAAEEVIVVSAQFRDIYARVAAARYRVITNGVDPMPRAPRPTRDPARPVLGFIGGLSGHKGYDLVRFVFHLRPLPNLRLVIVDHAMMEGEAREEMWGLNRVERIGRVGQADVEQLYARLDYLLAPSLWPESFGLVSREAALAGVYVVASDRGAVGDDLVEGVTGSRVSVDTHEPFLDLLVAIDEGRFRPALPVPFVPVKSCRQQADEVVACLLGHAERMPSRGPGMQA